MKRLLTFFIINYKFTFTLTLFLIVFGFIGLMNMNRESYPNVDFARAIITTHYPGSSPEEVEEKVTKKIEEEIRSVDGIKDVRSISQSGMSEISVRVELEGVDIDKAMTDLQSAVQRVSSLPSGILENPKFMRLNSKEIPILKIGVTGPNEMRSRDKFAEMLKEELEDNKNVSKIQLEGFREREFQILLDPLKMKRHHVGISEVVSAVNKRSQNIPAGYLKSSTRQYLVRVQGQISDIEEMGEIVVRSNFDGNMVRVKDVATLLDGAEEYKKRARLNAKPATLLIISKKEKSDTIKTVSSLIENLHSFRKKLPPEYEIIIYDNESIKVEERLAIVISNALGGLIIVFLVLFIFLPGTIGFVASLSLPLALMGAIGLMPKIGANFNTITMLAMVIAIGMLVDNSVVVSENYARLRREGLNVLDAAIKAPYQFWIPISGTVATTIASFMPMLVTKGIMGDFIKYIPIVVSIALFMSLLESFFLLPARLKFTLKKPLPKEKISWFEKLIPKFENFIFKSIKLRYLVFICIMLILLGSVFLAIFKNRFELFPAEDVEKYFAKYELEDTGTLEIADVESARLTKAIRAILGKKNIEYIISQAGVYESGHKGSSSKSGDNYGSIIISIPREKAKNMNVSEVLKKFRSIPKGNLLTLTFDAAIHGPPVGQALSVTLRSNNEKNLRALVNEMKNELAKIDGIVELSDDEIHGKPEFNIKLDYEMMAKLKLSTEKVGVALRSALQGAIASELNMNNKEFNLRVRYSDENRETIDALKRTKIMEPSGNLISLTSIAKIRRIQGPSVKRHMDYKLSTTISANVIPKKITSIAANREANKIFSELSSKYSDVSINFGGEGESTKESMESLAQAMILAVLGILIILIFLFNSFLKPLVILSSVPLGFVGISLAFFIHSKPIGFLALIGAVGLSGVVVNSAIVLISYIDDLSRERKDLSVHKILAKASAHRLRAVLVTSLTTIAGLVPTAYSIGGHDSILVPMTLALSWGLAGGTIITLIWVPCILSIIDDVNLIFSKMKKIVLNKIFTKKIFSATGGDL